MKTFATLLFVLFIGAAVQAQNLTENVKVETIKMTVVDATETGNSLQNAQEVARLYMFSNARVKKALSFTTKRNKAKMA